MQRRRVRPLRARPRGAAGDRDRAAAARPRRGARAHARLGRQPDRLARAQRLAGRRAAVPVPGAEPGRRRRDRRGRRRRLRTRSSAAACGCTSPPTTASTEPPRSGCACRERQAVPLPDGASFDLGASLGIPALTAHRCLFADGPLDGPHRARRGRRGRGRPLRDRARPPRRRADHRHGQLRREGGARPRGRRRRRRELPLRGRGRGHPRRRARRRRPGRSRSRPAANAALDVEVLAPHGVVCAYAADGDLTTPVRPLMARNVSLRFVLIYGVSERRPAHGGRRGHGGTRGGRSDRASGPPVRPRRDRRRPTRRSRRAPSARCSSTSTERSAGARVHRMRAAPSPRRHPTARAGSHTGDMRTRTHAEAAETLGEQLDRLDDAGDALRQGDRDDDRRPRGRLLRAVDARSRAPRSPAARAAWPTVRRRARRAATTTGRGRCARSRATCTRSTWRSTTAAAATTRSSVGRKGARRSARRVRAARHPRPRAAAGPGRPAARPRRAASGPAAHGAAPDGDRHRRGVRVGEPPAPAPGHRRIALERRYAPAAASSTSHSAPGTMPAGSGSPAADARERRRLRRAGDQEERPPRGERAPAASACAGPCPATTSGGSITHRS